LAEIKGDPSLKSIPVVVLTGSSLKSDVKKSYSDGADGYLTKPIGIKEYSKVVVALQNYWFKKDQLPALNRP
jgi:CheY-like chemotaxis protein